MIFDNAKNKELYYKMHDGFKSGFEFIEKAIKEKLPVGKYEIDGKNVWASVQEYNSKDEAKWEAHKNYIDIQYIVSGRELMEYADINTCEQFIPYNEEKDVEFFSATSQADLICEKDTFAIFFPNDVHKPGLKINENTPVSKIVVKVRV